MPNWCNNGITLRHADPAMIERAAKAFQEGRFLQEFIPCPQDLIDTVSGFVGEEQAALEAKQAANREKYGYATWYEHNINEWGTKWDVNSDNVEIEDAITVTAGFESAWAPPVAAMEKLEVLGFSVRLYYYEPGMAFAGVYEDGCDDYYEYGGMTSEEIAVELPDDLDEMFGISESVAEWEEENAEDDENIDIDLDGGASATNEQEKD